MSQEATFAIPAVRAHEWGNFGCYALHHGLRALAQKVEPRRRPAPLTREEWSSLSEASRAYGDDEIADVIDEALRERDGLHERAAKRRNAA